MTDEWNFTKDHPWQEMANWIVWRYFLLFYVLAVVGTFYVKARNADGAREEDEEEEEVYEENSEISTSPKTPGVPSEDGGRSTDSERS